MAGKTVALALAATVALTGTPAFAASAPAATTGSGTKPVQVISLAKKKPKYKTCRASWYGPGFYGHTMAGGGKLKPTSMVIAHRTLPFGTRIRVVWKGKSVVARVQDRGPYVAGREMDLGPGVRWKLGFSGVQTIRYRILSYGK